jgi:hypothetical protein
MEPSKEVPAATQPVVNRAPRIMPVEKPALALQVDSATPKISGVHVNVLEGEKKTTHALFKHYNRTSGTLSPHS